MPSLHRPLLSLTLAFTTATLVGAAEPPQPVRGTNLVGPGGLVEHLSVLADGETVALWNTRCERVVFWNWRTGKERTPLNLKPTVMTPDGKTLLAAGKFWDIATGKQINDSKGLDLPRGDLAVITPDGKTVATALAQVVEPFHSPAQVAVAWVFDLDTRKRRPFEIFMPVERVVAAVGKGTDHIDHLAISPDGKHLALVNNGYTIMFPDRRFREAWSRIVLFDLATGKERHRFHLGERMEVRSLVFTPDGKTLTAGSSPGGVRTWDVVKGTERILAADTKQMVLCLAVSPDGKHLVASAENGAVVFSLLATGKEIGRLPASTRYGGNPPWRLAFSPDGYTLVACDSGPLHCNVWAWDIRDWLKKVAK